MHAEESGKNVKEKKKKKKKDA